MFSGFFPYFFHPEEGLDYVGDWPDAFFYNPANMKPAARDDFYKWHQQQQGKVFNFREELLGYCQSDVDILQNACMAFRKMMMKEQGVDPFPVSLTIASACNHIFRKNYLRENTIGIIPNGKLCFVCLLIPHSLLVCFQAATRAGLATASWL